MHQFPKGFDRVTYVERNDLSGLIWLEELIFGWIVYYKAKCGPASQTLQDWYCQYSSNFICWILGTAWNNSIYRLNIPLVRCASGNVLELMQWTGASASHLGLNWVAPARQYPPSNVNSLDLLDLKDLLNWSKEVAPVQVISLWDWIRLPVNIPQMLAKLAKQMLLQGLYWATLYQLDNSNHINQNI